MSIEAPNFLGREREVLPETRVVLVQPPLMALYEPSALHVLAGKIRDDEELKDQTDLCLIDAQIGRMPASGRFGASWEVRRENPDAVGISVHLFAWVWTKDFLRGLVEEYGKQVEAVPPVFLGGTWSTFLPQEYYSQIFRQFPFVVFVPGEGEEPFAESIKRIRRGESLEGVHNLVHMVDGQIRVEDYRPADLESYSRPERLGLGVVLDRGGMARVEWGRGCGKAAARGACVFCPRPPVESPRVVPEVTRLEDIRTLVYEFRVKEFQVTDEEALDFFPELRSIAEAIIEIKSIDERLDLSFSFSTRPDRILELEEWDASALDLLIEAGLKNVFLGAEGGSDDYLRHLGKGQTVEQVERAIDIVLNKGLNLELGMITFAPRMSFEELLDNVVFLKEEDRFKYVSWVLNELEVYEGSLEKRALERQGIPLGELDLNSLRYEVPYQDSQVERVVKAAREWAGRRGDPYYDLYYALKSLVRTKLVPETPIDRGIVAFQRRFRRLDFEFLETMTNLVGQEESDEVIREAIKKFKKRRSEAIADLRVKMDAEEIVDPREILYGEVVKFIDSEKEGISKTKLGGAAVVVKQVDGVWHVLMVEKAKDALQDKLEVPAGVIWLDEEEDPEVTIKRELGEELGLDGVEVTKEMPAIRIWGHTDTRGAYFDILVLFPFVITLPDGVQLRHRDRELRRSLWIPIENFRQRVEEMGYYVDEPVARCIESLAASKQKKSSLRRRLATILEKV